MKEVFNEEGATRNEMGEKTSEDFEMRENKFAAHQVASVETARVHLSKTEDGISMTETQFRPAREGVCYS